MALDITQYQLYKKILDSRNIFNAIFCMESYIFDKGLLNIEEPVKLLDEFGKVIDVIAKNDLELYYALTDKHNVELIEKVINVCQQKLQWIFSANENLFDAKGEFYQFNLSSCIRQQNSLTAQFVSFSLSNLANIFYPPQFLQ